MMTSNRSTTERGDRPLSVQVCSRRSGAFTLIELMAVITIMAIMTIYAVISVPKLMKAREVTTGSQQLAATLRQAQQVAIVRGTRARVTFEPWKNTMEFALTATLTNAVRVFYPDTQLATSLHPDGWVLDQGYMEPRVLGENVTCAVVGPHGKMWQYKTLGDYGGLMMTYKKAGGGEAYYYVKSIAPYAQRVDDYGNPTPAIGWADYPYIEFDSMGRATLTATVTVMAVANTNAIVSGQRNYSGTKIGNWTEVVVTRGEKAIKVN